MEIEIPTGEISYNSYTTRSPKAAPCRSELIHLMSTRGCIGLTEFGTVDGKIDNIDWPTSIDVTYSPPTKQTICKAKDTVTTVHKIQQKQRSQAYTRLYMVTEGAKGNRMGSNVEAIGKIGTGVSANVMPDFCFQEVSSQFLTMGKALEKFDWTTLTT